MDVGFLHPGLMGETLAANCAETALWVAAGRSGDTRHRAESNDLVECATLGALVDRADAIVSICPPAAAAGVAAEVEATGYDGLYVDANAISPATARTIAERFENFVDGSVIGPPAHTPGTTRLYLSGARADEVARWYEGSALDARVVGAEPGAASALKMAYASWTKIGSAMHLAIRALASAEGVDQALVDEWNLSQPGLADRSHGIAAGVSPKAWRFTGEMDHIAASFADADLPSGFADAANEVYRRMAGFKGSEGTTLAEVLDALLPDMH